MNKYLVNDLWGFFTSNPSDYYICSQIRRFHQTQRKLNTILEKAFLDKLELHLEKLQIKNYKYSNRQRNGLNFYLPQSNTIIAESVYYFLRDFGEQFKVPYYFHNYDCYFNIDFHPYLEADQFCCKKPNCLEYLNSFGLCNHCYNFNRVTPINYAR
jgi:hypothetical protein